MRFFSLILICGLIQDVCAVSKIAQEIDETTSTLKKISPKVMKLYRKVITQVKNGDKQGARRDACQVEDVLLDVYHDAQGFLDDKKRGVKMPKKAFARLRAEVLKREILISNMIYQAQASIGKNNKIIAEILEDSQKIQANWSY